MKIVHLSTARQLRGGERQLLLLHNGLLRRGIQSLVLCSSSGELHRQPVEGIFTDPWAPAINPLGIIAGSLLCRQQKWDCIHCHDGRAYTKGALIGCLCGIPVIISRKVLFSIKPTAFNRWKYRRCAQVIAVSEAVAQQCRAMVSAGKVTIINDAADVAQPMLSREESRAILGIDPADVALGTAGYFTKEKNVPLLLELASSLGREFPNVKLVCIGPIAPKMRAETRRRRNLLAVGYLPDAVRYYRAFDAYVSAATKEGFGSALLDAVARDIPCAALDSGGVRDQFGRFVKYLAHDAGELIRMVHSIIQDRAAALRYAQGQGAWARSIFSVENMLQKHIDVYTSVLARHS